MKTDQGGNISFAVAFAAVGEFHYALSYRWEDMVTVDGVGNISRIFTLTPAHIVARGVWVDAINHLNNKGLSDGVVQGMAAVYQASEVYPLYLNIRVPGAVIVKLETNIYAGGQQRIDTPTETLDDPNLNRLVHDGLIDGYSSGMGVDVLHMIKCSVRGWMWQELTFGRFPHEIDNVVGYLIYCVIITGRKLRPEHDSFKMQGKSIWELVQSALSGEELDYGGRRYACTGETPSGLTLDVARAMALRCREAVMADTERLWVSACHNLSNVNSTKLDDCVVASLAVLSNGELQSPSKARGVGGKVLAICQRLSLSIPVHDSWINEFVTRFPAAVRQGTAKQVSNSPEIRF